MELSTSQNKLRVIGNIKSIAHYEDIKNEIEKLLTNFEHIVIQIADSISITSSVIGLLNKLKIKNKISLEIHITDNNLYEIFDDLNLVKLFNVKKINNENLYI